MNMISNGSFLAETDASIKQEALVKKLTSAWEKKNSKTARAGGVSLMALTLAACGGEDDTPFSAADVEAAEATGFAAGVASVDITSDNAEVAAAAAAAAAAEATAAAEAAAAATAATVAEAAAAELAAANAATATAEAATAAAEAATAAAEAATAALQTTYDALVASNAELQSNYDALVAPKALAFAATTAETLNGGVGDDVFTGSGANYTNADKIRDTSSTDNDTANLTVTGDITPDVSGVENVNLTINSTATKTVTASSMAGVNTLTLTRGDVTVGDATIAGNKAHDIDSLDASDVANVVIAGTATSVTLDQATKAGVNLDADVASGSVTVIGAATVNAAGAGTGDTVTVEAMENAEAGTAALALVENAKAVTVNTNAATVNVIDSSANANEFTGAINVTANSATTVTIDDITGGGSVTATKDGADINVSNIDASGVTVTAGSGTSTNTSTITLDGSTATTAAVDNATVSASGIYTSLSLGANAAIDTLNLSGNGAAVKYTVSGTNLPSTYAASGDHNVDLAGNESVFSGAVITGVNTIDLTAGTAGAIDAADWSANKVDLGFDNTGSAITVGSDVTYEVTADQSTGLDFDFSATANGNVTIVAGDDNGTSTAVGTIGLNAVDADDGAASTGTLTIEASIANVTGTSLTVGAAQNVVITGDEDVSFTGVVTADDVDASASSGIITLTGLTSGVDTVTTGSGNDVITVNDASTDHVVSTGAGNDTITVTATQNGSFVSGEGNDTINVDDTGSYAVNAGAGADTVVLSGDADAILVGGAGTDILRVDATAAINNNTNASINGFETFDLDAALTLSAAQWAANNATVTISSNSSNGTLNLGGSGSNTSGITIDASSLTATSGYTGYTVAVSGTAYADTLTGGVLAETFNQSAGNDAIEGGSTGTDTFVAMDEADIDGSASGDSMNGVVVNLGSTSLDEATVVAQLSNHFGGSMTQISAGQATFTFNNASASTTTATNVAFTQTLGGIENVTGGNGDDYIVGSSSNNVLSGAAGIDYLDGGDGADTLYGGAAADTVKGGLGADTFVFNSFGAADTVSDFATGSDTFVIDIKDAATTVTNGVGTAIAKTYALIGTDGKATTGGTTGAAVSSAHALLAAELHTAKTLKALKTAVNALTAINDYSGAIAVGHTTTSGNVYLFVLSDSKTGATSGIGIASTFTIASVGTASVAGTDFAIM